MLFIFAENSRNTNPFDEIADSLLSVVALANCRSELKTEISVRFGFVLSN